MVTFASGGRSTEGVQTGIGSPYCTPLLDKNGKAEVINFTLLCLRFFPVLASGFEVPSNEIELTTVCAQAR